MTNLTSTQAKNPILVALEGLLRSKDIVMALSLVLLVGMLLITPATAHFTQNTRHLGEHAWTQVIRHRVYTRGESENLFQRRCRSGTALAWAFVDAAAAFPSTYTPVGVSPQFNCAGGSIRVRREGTGSYLVRIPGISDAIAPAARFVATVSNAQGFGPPDVNSNDEVIEYHATSDGGQRVLRVTICDAQESTSANLCLPMDEDFSLVLFGVQGFAATPSTAATSPAGGAPTPDGP